MSKLNIKDVQSQADFRDLAIDKTGVKGVKHPIVFEDFDENNAIIKQNSHAIFDMYVGLCKNVKGTHMSRFLEILHQQKPLVIGIKHLSQLLDNTLTLLEAESAHVNIDFCYFLTKVSPVTKIESFLDYRVQFETKVENQNVTNYVTVKVPVTTLCPCSKEISEFGAHNQRSEIVVKLKLGNQILSLKSIIKLIEKQGSCELFGIIKRPDEKAVTEKAYENAKFVEDVVRDVALALESLGLKQYLVSSENLESIHNHSAYAQIDKL
jgi:GTP cyclohydrolase I